MFRGQILLRENLREVGERFEFERVARRVEKKHRRLFADLTLEAAHEVVVAAEKTGESRRANREDYGSGATPRQIVASRSSA